MKNNIKNIAAAIIISGLFFIPVFCSAQFGRGILNESNNTENPVFSDDKSQAEVEAIEQIINMESMSDRQQFVLSDRHQNGGRMFTSISNVINDKSQAEAEAEEELQYIQMISSLRQVIISDQMQVISSPFILNSNILATNYDAQISVIQNRR